MDKNQQIFIYKCIELFLSIRSQTIYKETLFRFPLQESGLALQNNII